MNSGTAYQCSDCGKIMPQDMSHCCISTGGSLPPGTGWIDGVGTVRACIDCGVLVVGGLTRCMSCAQAAPPKFVVEYASTEGAPDLRAAYESLLSRAEASEQELACIRKLLKRALKGKSHA